MELLSALLGSLIGGLMTLWGTMLGARLQRKHQAAADAAAEAATIRGFLGAIEAELSVLWEVYSERFRPALARVAEGSIFDFEWPVRHDYFTVYTANAALLGRLPDGALRALIVRTYTAARGTLDSIAFNGEMIARVEALQTVPGPMDANRQALIDAHRSNLIVYAQGIKQSDAELGTLFETLLPRLKEAAGAVG